MAPTPRRRWRGEAAPEGAGERGGPRGSRRGGTPTAGLGEEAAAPQLPDRGSRLPGDRHPQPLPLLSVQPGHGAGQRALLHPLLPLLHLEPGRLDRQEAHHRLGLGYVPGPVHQGCDPLAAACLPSRGEAGGLLQLRVQHALHPRHVGHCHPSGARPAQLRQVAVSSCVWSDSCDRLVFSGLF